MPSRMNRQIVLASRPEGEPRLENFRLVEKEIPALQSGEVLLQTLWLSLDPYMRGHMNAGSSYSSPVQIGGVMRADIVSRVVDSNNTNFNVGDIVDGYLHWESFSVSDGSGLRK